MFWKCWNKSLWPDTKHNSSQIHSELQKANIFLFWNTFIPHSLTRLTADLGKFVADSTACVMAYGYDLSLVKYFIQLMCKESTDGLHSGYEQNPLKWPIDLLLIPFSRSVFRCDLLSLVRPGRLTRTDTHLQATHTHANMGSDTCTACVLGLRPECSGL